MLSNSQKDKKRIHESIKDVDDSAMLVTRLFLLLVGSLDNNRYTMSEKSWKIRSCYQK
jgi:hypothetical protein